MTNKTEGDGNAPGSAEKVVIFCDGAGRGPDGQGSGFAWVRADTGEKYVERLNGLTNNEAEYCALIAAIGSLSHGTHAEIVTDSQLVQAQFSNQYRVKDPRLVELLAEARRLIQDKNLRVSVKWVRRTENLAGKIL